MITANAHAAASALEFPNGTLPRQVQWMPPGRQTVQPSGFDAPFEMTVTPELARLADAQLQQLRTAAAAGKDVEPYFDFNHKDEGRAFKPTRFFWGGSDPKTGGIRAEGTWTGAGAKAVLDGELCCVSASWLLNKNTKEFLGIKHNVGGLVTRSAFHSIQAFAKAASTPDFVASMVLPASEVARLQELYGVDLTPRTDEKNFPFEILVARLAEKYQIAAGTIHASLQQAEPELWRFHLGQFNQVDYANSLPARMAEFQAQAHAYGVANGIADEADAQTAYARTKAGRLTYARAMSPKAPSGASVKVTHAKVMAELQAHPFVARAKAFGESNRIADPADAQLAFARTSQGGALYSEYRSSLDKISRTVAMRTDAVSNQTVEHAFIAHARAFAAENKIPDEVDAQVAFARTSKGKSLYAEYCEALAPRR